LIFDVDGTLVDSMPLHLENWEKIGRKYGFQYTRDDLEGNAGRSGQEIVEIINRNNGLQLDPDDVAHEKEAAFLECIDRVQPIEAVVKVLQEFSGHLPVGAGTGGFRRLAIEMLKAIGVWNKIDVLVGSEDVKNHKPAPDTFLLCAEKLNGCLVFEDAELGFLAARNAGMHLIDVRPFYNNEGEIVHLKR
jgi:beta-phosphoglucomutase-like phosphatase (HAD superfamily)